MVKKSDEGFPWQHRIVRVSDYRSVYRTGVKVHTRGFVLFGQANNLDHHRLGLTVSRKIGSAVVRNRVKRRFREIFRRSSVEIPHHFDFVVNAKRECAAGAFAALREEFLSAARKIC